MQDTLPSRPPKFPKFCRASIPHPAKRHPNPHRLRERLALGRVILVRLAITLKSPLKLNRKLDTPFYPFPRA